MRAHHAVVLLAVASAAAVTPTPEHFDVLVVGANAAGVAAAVTASDGNRYSVKVVEPLEMIGGMAAAGGVALMNQGGCGLTGLSRNWSMLCGEVRAHMQLPTPSPWLAEQRALAHSLGEDRSAVQHTPTVSTEERWKRSEVKRLVAKEGPFAYLAAHSHCTCGAFVPCHCSLQSPKHCCSALVPL